MEFIYDVFLCHNSHDKKLVERIAARITEETDLKPFLDKWNLIPGDLWPNDLQKALNSSRTVAVFIGSEGISPWQNEEMLIALQRHAKDHERRVIPVLLPNAENKKEIKELVLQRNVSYREFE